MSATKYATKLIPILGMIVPSLGMAATECNEWATMTQVLVIRWQGDESFKGKTAEDVKRELDRTMGKHPELPIAQKYVDIAYKNRANDPIKVWKQTFAQCNEVRI